MFRKKEIEMGQGCASQTQLRIQISATFTLGRLLEGLGRDKLAENAAKKGVGHPLGALGRNFCSKANLISVKIGAGRP